MANEFKKLSEPASGLELWAFGYVSGELSAAEELEFEAVLTESQAARDAVVRATQLMIAAATRGRPARSADDQPWSEDLLPETRLSKAVTNVDAVRSVRSAPKVHWSMFGGAAVCCALVLAAVVWNSQQADDFVTSQLAGKVEFVGPPLADEFSAESDEQFLVAWATSKLQTDDLEPVDDVSDERLEVPDWMLVALVSDEGIASGPASQRSEDESI